MSQQSAHEVTQLLIAWSDGDEAALEALVPLIQAELHRLARRYMKRELPGHALQTTALVNEAYIRLIDWKNARWQNRAHFFGGMSVEETAEVLQIAPITVMREWNKAKAWLHRELSR